MENKRDTIFLVAAGVLLMLMAVLAGGAALRESVTVDEVAHIGAGVSYLQKLDLRFNEEHPPLPKVLAALPLVLRGTHADYSHISWTFSDAFFPAYLGQWVFGEWLLTKWNDPVSTLAWARTPMLVVALILGWVLFVYARKLGGDWAGLLCLSVYVSTPAFIAFAPLVHTDLAVTLFSLLTLWRFAEIWRNPIRKNAVLFGICLAAALLSKFTAIILFFVFVAFALSTRWRPVSGQPIPKDELRAWRRLRWRVTLRGILWAALIVYLFYFVFSIHQPTTALDRLGHGAATEPLRRLLMPPWLYLRGVLIVLVTASRPTYILGHSYPHGVWFYFPVLFLFKSALGFLGLLALALSFGLTQKRSDDANPPAIPEEFAIHWRVLWVSLIVFTGFCLLSRLDISIRHFSIPLVLLILLLAPLSRMIDRLHYSKPNGARFVGALAVVLTLSCLFTAVRAYPYYFPYINALSLGRPGYVLVNDSNLDWNQSLPEVKAFAEQRGLQSIDLDEYGFTDATVDVPQAKIWDCQTPTAGDEGKWAAVSANMIMDGHNCPWLLQYEHLPLAGGSMYAVHLPDHIPEVGIVGGPPRPSEFREFGGAPFDMRSFFLNIIHYPEKLPQAWEEMQARFKSMNKPQSSPTAP
ncbi:MAG TPA: glycosyltransferase family 39 protein [Verrucomicrobiae bacterium]|jgi:4-amino-4-deoxy-L-arabinose transferase-like glycosyltransferase|nr:glycosyltransferase family 39 protein [Verrucomicrobiae bacterium]